jgi:hypothetical protein
LLDAKGRRGRVCGHEEEVGDAAAAREGVVEGTPSTIDGKVLEEGVVD